MKEILIEDLNLPQEKEDLERGLEVLGDLSELSRRKSSQLERKPYFMR